MDKPSSHPKRTKILIVALIILCLGGAGSGVFFFVQYSQVQAKANQKEDLTKRIATLVVLPDDSSTLVTVADKTKLQNKQLADKVSNGDVLMIFAKSQRLIIYRPNDNKIVDMLSFSAQDTSAISKTQK
jgi:Na+-translocating ferredoxin:NAD+ oxidoreductase RnfG subunit